MCLVNEGLMPGIHEVVSKCSLMGVLEETIVFMSSGANIKKVVWGLAI